LRGSVTTTWDTGRFTIRGGTEARPRRDDDDAGAAEDDDAEAEEDDSNVVEAAEDVGDNGRFRVGPRVNDWVGCIVEIAAGG
jgi:hypothetical protein